MAEWCGCFLFCFFKFSLVLIKWWFICWNRGYCILSLLQAWTGISSLKHRWAVYLNLNTGIKKILSIGLLYIQVSTVSVNSDFILFFTIQQCFLWKFVYSCTCLRVCVCVWLWSTDEFAESTYSWFDWFRRLPRHTFTTTTECTETAVSYSPGWIVWIKD